MGRAPCCSKIGLNRGPWSIEEDKLLIHYIQTHGEGHWRSLPSKAGLLRCGKSCRLRWVNYLRPGVKRGNFTSDENDTIIRLHSLHGNRWSLIAAEFPGRTDNEIKNHWNTHLRKKQILVHHANPTQPTTMAPLHTKISLTQSQVKIDIPSTPSSEDDQRINMITNNVIAYDNRSTEQIKAESKMVNDNIGTPTSSGASYSSSVITEGEVNMNMNMNTNTNTNANMNTNMADTFFYELDDFIDVDQKMKGCDYMISRDEKLERVYMEYVQLLNYGGE